MKAKYIGSPGVEIYNKVLPYIVKTKTINEAYKLVPVIKEAIGDQYSSAIMGAIDFYYDELIQDAWNGKPLEDYMQSFL